MSEAIGPLLVVRPDGTTERIEGVGYEVVKAGLDGGTLDFVFIAPEIGLFINDNGMVEGLPLNVVASQFTGHAFYGPVVLAHGFPDDEGETLPPQERVVKAMENMGLMWQGVLLSMEQVGQSFDVRANPATVPGPKFIPMDAEEFDTWLSTGQRPE